MVTKAIEQTWCPIMCPISLQSKDISKFSCDAVYKWIVDVTILPPDTHDFHQEGTEGDIKHEKPEETKYRSFNPDTGFNFEERYPFW